MAPEVVRCDAGKRCSLDDDASPSGGTTQPSGAAWPDENELSGPQGGRRQLGEAPRKQLRPRRGGGLLENSYSDESSADDNSLYDGSRDGRPGFVGLGLIPAPVNPLCREKKRRDGVLAPQRAMAPYDSKVDIWALGCLAFECLFGQSPFFGGSAAVVESRICAGEVIFPVGGSVPPLARSFVAACTQPTPECRPDAQSLGSHPWLGRSAAEAAPPPRLLPGKDLSRNMSVPSDLCRHLSAAQLSAPEEAFAAAPKAKRVPGIMAKR